MSIQALISIAHKKANGSKNPFILFFSILFVTRSIQIKKGCMYKKSQSPYNNNIIQFGYKKKFISYNNFFLKGKVEEFKIHL